MIGAAFASLECGARAGQACPFKPRSCMFRAMTPNPLIAVRERAQANLFWRYLGVEVDEAGEGSVRLRVPVREALCNAAGAPVHGGVYSALVDMAVGGALST